MLIPSTVFVPKYYLMLYLLYIYMHGIMDIGRIVTFKKCVEIYLFIIVLIICTIICTVIIGLPYQDFGIRNSEFGKYLVFYFELPSSFSQVIQVCSAALNKNTKARIKKQMIFP